MLFRSSAHGFDVYRDGERIATVSAGPYHDKLDRSGSGSYRYHVTETMTAACSNDAAVTFREPCRCSTTPQPQRDRDRAIAHAARAQPLTASAAREAQINPRRLGGAVAVTANTLARLVATVRKPSTAVR